MAHDVESGPAKDDLMRVTVLEYGAETWVHVSSSTVVDWPTVAACLSPEVRGGLIGEPVYWPATPAEGGLFADWWVFGTQNADAWWED